MNCLNWMDGVIGFIAGLIVMVTVIIIGCYIGRDDGGINE